MAATLRKAASQGQEQTSKGTGMPKPTTEALWAGTGAAQVAGADLASSFVQMEFR